MNWYSKIILAQIWDTDSEGTFEDELKVLYEMEYKLNALKNFHFEGLPQRRYNIIKMLEEAVNNVIEPITNTFRRWLESHALLDPTL